ncbi:hypothetical protein [Fodinibius sediminis]|uniref:Uncharacterized protein n=1 Tax=Fodinibius sediminis TaxID=1214077 RepID=A0A521CW11_9BACT|nr:hypothetical protein [Fodinibius sediminis]SMO62860.1 hypothetical protein SAMN06265218_107115 [Fodinibius sediminis]
MNRINTLATLVFCLLIIGCRSSTSEYEQWVAEELDRGVHRDSLLLGYHFGMTRQDFYDHSWELNSRKIVMQGVSNRSVRQEVDYLDYAATRNFYPSFYNDAIFLLPVRYAYSGWAPWNKERWSDSLLVDLVAYYENEYEADFRRLNHPDFKTKVHVAIEGNRSIVIKKKDDQYVNVIFTDLEAIRRMKNGEND